MNAIEPADEIAASSPRSSVGPLTAWRWPTRVAFRFFLIYFLFYTFPDSLEFIPGAAPWIQKCDDIWHRVIPWVGAKLFHVNITVFPAGSGDTTYNYVQVFVLFCIASIGAIIWSAVARRTTDHRNLHRLLYISARYIVGITLLGYGMAKVIQSQFPFPHITVLTETYGESSPMRLLWTFMGYSRGYNLFAGIVEGGGGLLLMFRRTTLLGAMIATATLMNIVALNFFYDVPVKLYSLHLLIFTIFLLLPESPRIARFFFLNQSVPASTERALIPWRPLNWLWQAAKTAGLCWLIYTMANMNLANMREFAGAMNSPLFGLYSIEEFSIDGKLREPIATDTARWREVVLAGSLFGNATMRVRKMDDSAAWYQYRVDQAAHTLTLSNRRFTATTAPVSTAPSEFVLNYAEPDPQHLVITGPLAGKTISVKLKKTPLEKFLLVSRGFHWINEFPYNR